MFLTLKFISGLDKFIAKAMTKMIKLFFFLEIWQVSGFKELLTKALCLRQNRLNSLN